MAFRKLPKRIILQGNEGLARTHIGEADSLLNLVEIQAGFQKLTRHAMRRKLGDGTVIEASVCIDQGYVKIWSPSPVEIAIAIAKEKEKEKEKLEELRRGRYGWVYMPIVSDEESVEREKAYVTDSLVNKPLGPFTVRMFMRYFPQGLIGKNPDWFRYGRHQDTGLAPSSGTSPDEWFNPTPGPEGGSTYTTGLEGNHDYTIITENNTETITADGFERITDEQTSSDDTVTNIQIVEFCNGQSHPVSFDFFPLVCTYSSSRTTSHHTSLSQKPDDKDDYCVFDHQDTGVNSLTHVTYEGPYAKRRVESWTWREDDGQVATTTHTYTLYMNSSKFHYGSTINRFTSVDYIWPLEDEEPIIIKPKKRKGLGYPSHVRIVPIRSEPIFNYTRPDLRFFDENTESIIISQYAFTYDGNVH